MSRSPTTKKFKKISPEFDVNAFETDLSKGELGLSRASERIRKALTTGTVSDVLSDLLSKERRAHLFEYTVSILEDGLVSMLRKELLAGFNLEDFTTLPSTVSALGRLAVFFVFFPYPSNESKPLSLTEDYQFIHSSQEVLGILANAGFMQGSGSSRTPQNDNDDGSLTKTAKKSKQAKRAKRPRAQTLKIDEKPFSVLEERVPSTQSEAQELAVRLLEKQKELLGELIDRLRHPALCEIIRESYMPTITDTAGSTSPTDPQVVNKESTEQTEAAENTLSAYPRVQPLKASLFFDSAKGFGEWRIYMSTTAIKDLRIFNRRDQKIFKIISKKLQELSNGLFSDDNQKRLQGPSKGIPIFEAKLTGDLRLVYQIDLASDFESNFESQVIRVYGIFTHAQMDNRMWESLSSQLAKRGSEYHRRIASRQKVQAAGNEVYLPQSWSDISNTEDSVEDAGINSHINVADLGSIHQWVVLEKYSVFSRELLNCILHESDSSPVFSVSPYERDVIEHPSSCYVLGRSGTGKTTTMTFKMFGIERSAQAHAMEVDTKPRQLFVTQSRVLASRVKDYYMKLSKFLSAASGTLPSAPVEQGRDEHEEGLGDPEDDEDWRDDLPKRFSELQESHFPLFLTFDKLYKLLEADLDISFARPKYTKEHRRAERRYNLHSKMNIELDDIEPDDSTGMPGVANSSSGEAVRSSLVTFEIFCNDYWPHFDQSLTKRLDPALVFSEFLGVIKGSEEVQNSETPYLSREAYLGLSERTRFTFAAQREKIYCLFEKYLALKSQYGDYDLADRSHAIIRRVNEDYKCSVDFLYVDEAQDNLIIDAFVLRRLCRNPHGLFWAGDTAQTIAIGSSFRFDDLKAALYGFERKLYPLVPEKVLVQPTFFQLTTNYRSHGGIVNCAGLVIELITYFWPHSIDTLRREKGVVDGSKPVFFTGWNDETARYEQFLLGENGNSIDFGAQQCILVRNDQARNELRKQVGEIGVIMTLYESKGLEFDDVLLYNFFEDSPCLLSQWRMVLNFLPKEGGNRLPVPLFDKIRHAGICTELKFFYVAVTRARKNLWIIDRSEKGEPMKTLLLEKKKVEICTPDKAPKLAVTSTSEEWAKTGKLLFSNKRYQQAMHCFERAGLRLEYAIAEAYYFREQARNNPRKVSVQIRNEAFKKAAHAFSSCAEQSPASRSRKKYYHIAAECFREARANGQAARAYENAEEYTDAAKWYGKAIMFDDAVRIVKTSGLVDNDIAERIIGASRLHYIHVERLDKAMDLFDSREEGLEFLDDCGFDTARATVLEKIGRIHEAADIHFREGRSRQAIELLIQDNRNPQSVQRVTDFLLKSLWNHYSFGVEIRRDDSDADYLLYVARSVDKGLFSQGDIEELEMFDAIRRNEVGARLSVYRKFRTRNLPATILILDHILHGSLHGINNTQPFIDFLSAWRDYAENLSRVWKDPNWGMDPAMQRLFGVCEVSKDEFLLMNGSFLATYTADSPTASFRRSEAGIVLDLRELWLVSRNAIKLRLRSMVQSQVVFCSGIRNKRFGEPCLSHVLHGQCHRSDCPRPHIDLNSVDATWFNVRVRIHLLQIIILCTVDFVWESLSDRSRIRDEWLVNLFNVLNPPLLALGNMVSISNDHIPEFNDGMRAISSWIEDRAYQIDPNHLYSWWFLNAVTVVATFSLWQDRNKARRLLLRARFYTGERVFPVHKEPLKQLRVPDLVGCLDFSYPGLVQSGCLFMHNVVWYRLTIDVNFVCRLAEQLCTASILLFMNMHGTFHDCLLPRSWLSYVLPKLNFDLEYNIRELTWVLIERCADLASHLLVGSDNEISHLRGAFAYTVRILAIQRILRAITLVGCNTTRKLRDFVISIVTKLRVASRQPIPDVLKPYLSSKSWSGLRRAVESSVPRSNLDQMIQLVQIGHNPFRSSMMICRITFKDKEDLLQMFAPVGERKSSKLSATAEAFVPGSLPLGIKTIDTSVTQSNEDPTADEGDDESLDGGQEEDGPDDLLIQPSLDGLNQEPSTVTFTVTFRERNAARIIMRNLRALRHRKGQAACRIQRWYKAIRAHRDMMEDPGLLGKRAKIHRDCVAEADHRKWPSSHHRFVYLGAIPDLLLYLDAVQSRIQSIKVEAKRQLKPKSKSDDSRIIDYDEVHLRMTRANADRKQLEKLKEQLAVKSKWHSDRTLKELRVVAQEIVAFHRLGLEGDVFNVCLDVMTLIQERKPSQPKKVGKPSLNVDDSDCLDDLDYLDGHGYESG